MATFLDVGLIENLSVLFPFLLTFAIVLGVLSTTKILGENKAVQALIAVILAFFTFLSPMLRAILNKMAPWFIILFIFIIFVIITFKTYGATDSDITGLLHSPRYGSQIAWFFITIILIITIGSIANVTLRGTDKGLRPTDVKVTTAEGGTTTSKSTTEGSTFWDTLLHPKVLGIAVILLIANITIARLASGGFPK